MIDASLQLKITRGQIQVIEKRLSQQLKAHQELLILSCEMYTALYDAKMNRRLLQRWHQIIQQLLF